MERRGRRGRVSGRGEKREGRGGEREGESGVTMRVKMEGRKKVKIDVVRMIYTSHHHSHPRCDTRAPLACLGYHSNNLLQTHIWPIPDVYILLGDRPHASMFHLENC